MVQPQHLTCHSPSRLDYSSEANFTSQRRIGRAKEGGYSTWLSTLLEITNAFKYLAHLVVLEFQDEPCKSCSESMLPATGAETKTRPSCRSQPGSQDSINLGETYASMQSCSSTCAGAGTGLKLTRFKKRWYNHFSNKKNQEPPLDWGSNLSTVRLNQLNLAK